MQVIEVVERNAKHFHEGEWQNAGACQACKFLRAQAFNSIAINAGVFADQQENNWKQNAKDYAIVKILLLK